MELLYLPQSWKISHQIEEGNDEPASTDSTAKSFVYSTAESVSRIRRPVWNHISPCHQEDHVHEGEDDYAWYYQHPERYIRRPRRRRSIKQKDKQFTVFDLLLNVSSSRSSWSEASISETLHSERWSPLGLPFRPNKDLER